MAHSSIRRNCFAVVTRGLLFVAALSSASPAFAVWNTYAIAPGPEAAARPELLQLPPGSPSASTVRLEADATLESRILALKRANSVSETKVLQIGVGRDVPQVPEASSAALRWERVAGGMAAQWRVSSLGARALRIGLEATYLPPGAQLRFSGEDGAGTVYGPFAATDIFAMGPIYWSPVLEGDSAIVEVFVADGASYGEVFMAIARVSHLFASPRDANIDTAAKVGESGACEVDLICRSATDAALATVGRAVARMTFTTSTGGTALCTGTLLNPRGGSLIPYFYSANHCISTQSSASTLATHWFYDRTVCGSGSPGYTQLTGGATLLYADATSDVLLLRLNSTPPAGAVYAGWDEASLASGTATTAVHHPAGDVKKVSIGTSGGFSAYGGGPGSTHIVALWNSTATGVTEGGSSGSGLFTAVGSPATEYRLRGGLHGGPSSCSATGTALRDYYSRFDQAYPSMSQYLNPATTANPARLVNIATRMQVLTGDNVMIGGFVIGGSSSKTVVVRARGPSLVAQGVPNALANPVLNLYSGQTVIASNDNFGTASNLSQLQASGFAPSNALESAILVTLNPGAYTAIVSGASGGTGVAIVEVFTVP
mgnify:CR=1 FL=1